MPSPDVSTYVDLTLYDMNPEEIADEAITYAQTSLPEFTPKTGTVEDAIIQATAQMSGEVVGAINRMTAGTMEIVLQLFGLTRLSGTQATGSLTVTVINSLGYTVPSGTTFGYYDTTDATNPILYAFTTDADLTIAPGDTTGTVAITAATYAEYPALQSGQSMRLLTPVACVSSAVLAADISIGTDAESDAEFFARAIAALNSYTQALVLPSQMEQYVLATYSDVYRAKAYSRVNSTNDDWVDAAENGYVTMYVSRVGGASLSAGVATTIEGDLADRSTAGLNINVKAPLVETVTIAATVTALSGYNSLDIQNAVTDALDAYLHPDFWDWSETIYYNELVSLIDQATGVDLVVSLTINAGTTDYSFTRRGTLPQHSSTITVS